ncbi:MAG: hypothetical protein AUG51_02475 [Acidobacteria bacterium 13_1_20CM_3_53_8]|nr:MAG: hypothetical protein AUG51_02475 [Acidobacteria bacterium 13_1_20CM_3_53_8]
MGKWESLVDKKIREAMEAGEFKDLPGKGERLNLEENPYEDPDLRTAHKLLRDAGYSLPWIDERRAIDNELEEARKILSRAYVLFKKASASRKEREGTEIVWLKRVEEFRSIVEELNARIRRLNLKVPAAGFQRMLVDVDKEIEAIEKESV